MQPNQEYLVPMGIIASASKHFHLTLQLPASHLSFAPADRTAGKSNEKRSWCATLGAWTNNTRRNHYYIAVMNLYEEDIFCQCEGHNEAMIRRRWVSASQKSMQEDTWQGRCLGLGNLFVKMWMECCGWQGSKEKSWCWVSNLIVPLFAQYITVDLSRHGGILHPDWMSSHWSLPPSQWNSTRIVKYWWLKIGWLLTIPHGTLLSPLSQVGLLSNSRTVLDRIPIWSKASFGHNKTRSLDQFGKHLKITERPLQYICMGTPPKFFFDLLYFVTFSGCRQLHLTVTVSKEYCIFCTLVNSKCAKLAGFTWTSRAGLVGKTWVPLCDVMISDPLWHYDDMPISFNICRESTLFVINQFVCSWPEKQPWQVERLVSGGLRTVSAKFILPLAHLNIRCISCVVMIGIYCKWLGLGSKYATFS